MADATFTLFALLPKELQIEVWEYAAAPGVLQAPIVARDGMKLGRHNIRHPHCAISAHIRKVIGGTSWYGTRHNINAFQIACVRRKILMSTCQLARQIAIEMWKKDIEKTTEDSRLYNCIWIPKKEKGDILTGLELLINRSPLIPPEKAQLPEGHRKRARFWYDKTT